MMDRLGDKVKSKIVANEVGAPTIPGITETIPSEEVALRFAEECGYPVMLKAQPEAAQRYEDSQEQRGDAGSVQER